MDLSRDSIAATASAILAAFKDGATQVKVFGIKGSGWKTSTRDAWFRVKADIQSLYDSGEMSGCEWSKIEFCLVDGTRDLASVIDAVDTVHGVIVYCPKEFADAAKALSLDEEKNVVQVLLDGGDGHEKTPETENANARLLSKASRVGKFKSIKTKGKDKGEWIFDNGDRYEGKSKDDLMEGSGVYTTEDGTVYTGNFVKGKKDGKGTMQFANGGKYIGSFKKGKRHGKGTETIKEGTYKGDWKENRKHGKGTYKWSSGGEYTGDWVYDMRTGQGTHTKANGDTYSGGWLDNRKHGSGEMKFSNGDHYKGEWEANKMSGQGVYKYAGGEEYTGSWKSGARHGEGTMKYTKESGKGDENGQWDKNVFIGNT